MPAKGTRLWDFESLSPEGLANLRSQLEDWLDQIEAHLRRRATYGMDDGTFMLKVKGKYPRGDTVKILPGLNCWLVEREGTTARVECELRKSERVIKKVMRQLEEIERRNNGGSA